MIEGDESIGHNDCHDEFDHFPDAIPQQIPNIFLVLAFPYIFYLI